MTEREYDLAEADAIIAGSHRMMLEQGEDAPSWFVQAHVLGYCNMPECHRDDDD